MKNLSNEDQELNRQSSRFPRPALERDVVWAWQFDPLEPERGVEITYGGKACAIAPTLNNASLLVERLNRHDDMLGTLDAVRTAIRKRYDLGRPEFNDGIGAALDAVDEIERPAQRNNSDASSGTTAQGGA